MIYEPGTCEHPKHESCMICCVCGECSEALDENDVCPDCKTTDDSLEQKGGDR